MVDFIHIFWLYPIASYWQNDLDVNASVVHIPIALTPRFCLQGLVEEFAHKVALKTLLSLLLFNARKAITLHWNKVFPSFDLLFDEFG